MSFERGPRQLNVLHDLDCGRLEFRMKSAFASWLSVVMALSLAVPGRAQDKRPADDAKKSIAEWIKQLKECDNDYQKSEAARKVLGPEGQFAKTAIPALIDALDEKRKFARLFVVATLSDYGPTAVPHLVRALKRQEDLFRGG
jgi:HEAT repeat protein